MKKKYSQPDIIYDEFSLCTSIAAGCEVQTNTPSWNQCGFVFDDAIVYTDDVHGCKFGGITITDGGLDGICYHVPTDDNNLFNS